MKKLNLGCGQFPKVGYLNVDIDPNSKADKLHDLSVVPYPFVDEEFDLIEMDHVLEHLPNPLDTMRELRRILKTKGRLIVRVPHFSRGFTHWDHKRGFDVTFPLYFDPSFKGGYSGIEFTCSSIRLVWFSQPWLKKIVLPSHSYWGGALLGKFFDFIGNLNHFFTSRLLCFWVGGYEEIEFIFEK